jgi:hypothetical protein
MISRAYDEYEWKFMDPDYFVDEDLGWKASHNLDI